MFQRQELIEYFSGQYTEEQVHKALKALAKYDNSVNPDGEIFADEITEQLEGAFEIGEKVLDSSHSHFSIIEATEVAIDAAAKSNLNLNPRVFDELIYIVSERAIARAAALNKIGEAVFDSASAQLDAEQLEKLRDRNERQIKAFQLIASNDERINKILGEYGVNTTEQTQEWIETYDRVLDEEDEDFDPAQYLVELNTVVGDNEPKKYPPLNKSQSRKLIKAIFTQARSGKLAG